MNTFLGAVALSLAVAGESLASERYTLGNGITVILEVADRGAFVGVEAVYPVGFAHEPAGMPQAAHLVEHLVCNSAIASFERGGSMRELSAVGMANAETLAHVTHYDMLVPADRLELALAIEAERLTSLRFGAQDVAIEGPRCASELVAVESHESHPVHKFALMAANQSWRHGATRVTLKSLDAAPVDRLDAFHRAHYTPSNLTLTLVGPFDAAAVKQKIEAALGSIPRGGPAPAPAAIEWAAIEPMASVEWDGAVRVVVLAWPAPDDPASRLVLAAWADLFSYSLMHDGAVSKVTPMLLADGRGALAGSMPFTIVAPLRDGIGPEAAIAAIEAALALALEKGLDMASAASLRPLGAQIVAPAMDGRMLGAQAAAYATQSGISRDRAEMLVMGNAAMQLGLAEVHARGRGEEVQRSASAMDPGAMTGVLRSTLAPEKRVTRILAPIP